MDNWSDRDNWFIDEDGNYDDSWLKPNVDSWRSIHPSDYNPYDNDRPWGEWDTNKYEDP